MKLKDILPVLDSIAPFEKAEQWDNVGLMVGDPCQEVGSILVALDPSFEAIEAAVEAECNLIITHHPLIMAPLKRIDFRESIPKKIRSLIQSDISLASMHTNFDVAEEGVADVLAKKLSLENVQTKGALKVGSVRNEMPLCEWANSLPFGTMRLVDSGRPVKRVGACPGSGMSYLNEAFAFGCDTFVTGDVKYHTALDAKEAGINIVDLGHFFTEEIAIAPLAEKLRRELPGLSVKVYKAQDVFMNHKGELS